MKKLFIIGFRAIYFNAQAHGINQTVTKTQLLKTKKTVLTPLAILARLILLCLHPEPTLY